MAQKKSTQSNVKTYVKKNVRKRPGIHSKKKNSVNKKSKNYQKKYKGQGR